MLGKFRIASKCASAMILVNSDECTQAHVDYASRQQIATTALGLRIKEVENFNPMLLTAHKIAKECTSDIIVITIYTAATKASTLVDR